MKRILWFTMLLQCILFSQQKMQIISYDVRSVINDRTGEMTGNTFIRITRGSGNPSFLVPTVWEINSIRDAENESYDTDRSGSGNPNFYRITLDGIDSENGADTVILNIEFTASFDSSSLSGMFINTKEILLPCTDSLSWLPGFGDSIIEHGSIEITCNSSFSLFSDRRFDTTSSDAMRTWKLVFGEPATASTAFTLCGIANPVKQASYHKDSISAVSFYSSPARFNQQYAAAIADQLTDAMQYFAAVTGQERLSAATYAIVGEATFEPEVFQTNNFIIHRNSPVFSLFDSSALQRVQFNHWLFETAQRFCPQTTDSTAVFNDGFAAYLCIRYLAARYPALAHQERVTTIAHALTFFPSGTIASGHHSPGNTNEIISYRGRYLFLMLEYLLGKESFDSVIVRMSAAYAGVPVSFPAFQMMCEESYGSSLSWFFDQWLYRSTAPEYVMQWKHDKTPRGMSIVTVTVDQRGELFTTPVSLHFSFGSRTITKRILVEQSRQEFLFTFPIPPTAVEFDPQLNILRWLLEIRISAHARTSLQYLSVSRDLPNAEREALYTLQLDPNNSTGSAPLLFFVLGNSASASGDLEKGKEYFLKAMSSGASASMEKYKLLSLVQYANILEMEGKRDEAVALYRRAISEGMRAPLLYERAIIKAELHLRGVFNSQNNAWFELH